jgi:hypothetical protein
MTAAVLFECVQTACRPARTALISSMAARMAGDIAPRGIFGKRKCPIYGLLRLTDANHEPALSTPPSPHDAKGPQPSPRWNPTLSAAPTWWHGSKNRGDATMKSLIALSPSGEGRLVRLVQLMRNSPYGQP